jgi:hypothetical protein
MTTGEATGATTQAEAMMAFLRDVQSLLARCNSEAWPEADLYLHGTKVDAKALPTSLLSRFVTMEARLNDLLCVDGGWSESVVDVLESCVADLRVRVNDLERRRVPELLEHNNSLLERARAAERQAKGLAEAAMSNGQALLNAEAQLRSLRLTLTLCAARFREYEALHLAKGTPEGLEKAESNAGMALLCEEALAATKGVPDAA